VTLTGFTLGQTYIFKVKARNAFSFGEYSDPVTILSARTPNQPDAPLTTVDGDNVIVDWTAPVDNGSPIIGYRIYLR
jgi:hypothetical protein